MKRRLSLCRAVVVVLAATGPAAPATAQSTAGNEADATFSANVVVTRAIVDAKGSLVRELPSSRYRLAQFADGRLRMTVLPLIETATAGPLGDAFAGITVENNPASGAIEVRDKQGRPLGLDPPPTGGWMAAPGEPSMLVASADSRAARRTALERRFGAPAGRVRGLDRYVTREGSAVHEMLVHPESALPAEVNVAEGKTLLQHHRFDYRRLADGTWIRRRMASETAMPGTPSQRLVAVSTLDDVQTAGGAR
jgi:hypothetical protein